MKFQDFLISYSLTTTFVQISKKGWTKLKFKYQPKTTIKKSKKFAKFVFVFAKMVKIRLWGKIYTFPGSFYRTKKNPGYSKTLIDE